MPVSKIKKCPGVPGFRKRIKPVALSVLIWAFLLSLPACWFQKTYPPKVITVRVTNVTQTSADCEYEVTHYGEPVDGNRHGVVWSKSAKRPTLDDKDDYSSTYVWNKEEFLGKFNVLMTGLTPNTEYYARAFAANDSETGYGEVLKFTTAGGIIPCPDAPTVKDKDGNTYNTVLIGDQCWMRENLKTTTYRNGTAIQSPGYVWWENLASWKDSYGALYNYQAVTSQNGICPDGWHVPTHAEWELLINVLGGPEEAGGKMKSSRTDPDDDPRWDKPNTGGNNDSGFSAFPGGYRYTDGDFYDLGKAGLFWSSTAYDNDYVWVLMLQYDIKAGGLHTMSMGYSNSIRCIKN